MTGEGDIDPMGNLRREPMMCQCEDQAEHRPRYAQGERNQIGTGLQSVEARTDPFDFAGVSQRIQSSGMDPRPEGVPSRT